MSIKDYLNSTTEYIQEECYLYDNSFAGLIIGTEEDYVLVTNDENNNVTKIEMNSVAYILNSVTNKKLFPMDRRAKKDIYKKEESIINNKVLEYISAVSQHSSEEHPIIRDCKILINTINNDNMNEIAAKIVIKLTQLLDERL